MWVIKDQGIGMAPPNKLSLDWDQTISKNKKVASKLNKTKKKSVNKKVENIQTDLTVHGLYLGDEMSIKDGEETTGMETISNIMSLGKRKKGETTVDQNKSIFKENEVITGNFLSEALILASINPLYDNRLLIQLQEKYKFSTCCVHKLGFLF